MLKTLIDEKKREIRDVGGGKGGCLSRLGSQGHVRARFDPFFLFVSIFFSSFTNLPCLPLPKFPPLHNAFMVVKHPTHPVQIWACMAVPTCVCLCTCMLACVRACVHVQVHVCVSVLGRYKQGKFHYQDVKRCPRKRPCVHNINAKELVGALMMMRSTVGGWAGIGRVLAYLQQWCSG